MNALLEKKDVRTVVPSPSDSQLATESNRILAKQMPANGEFRVHMENGEVLKLPTLAVRLLQHILTEMSHGNAVTLFPVHAELTTQEAADFLNVSRPYLIRLLEQKKIPYTMVGTHRRIKFEDLSNYKNATQEAGKQALDELTDQAQELSMGY